MGNNLGNIRFKEGGKDFFVRNKKKKKNSLSEMLCLRSLLDTEIKVSSWQLYKQV